MFTLTKKGKKGPDTESSLLFQAEIECVVCTGI